MDRKTAEQIKNFALNAIENLSSSLITAQNKCSNEDFEKIKKIVGLSIIKIDSDLLGILYEHYPDLDDLKSQ